MISEPKNPESGICCILQQKVKNALYATATRVVARYVYCTAFYVVGSVVMLVASFHFIDMLIAHGSTAWATDVADAVAGVPWWLLAFGTIEMIYKINHWVEDVEKARAARKRLHKLGRVNRRAFVRGVKRLGSAAKKAVISAIRR